MSVKNIATKRDLTVFKRGDAKYGIQHQENLKRTEEVYPLDRNNFTPGGVGNTAQLAKHQFQD